MDLYTIWPYFVLMLAMMLLINSRWFAAVDNAPGAGMRYSTLDGLRGFLAFGVFVFHLVITHQFIETGEWEEPASRFYSLLGPVGVSLFFMITGFLFWSKMLRSAGKPKWYELYHSRFFRIAPMYLFVVFVMLQIVFARTGYQLHEPASNVVWSVMQWLALGLVDIQPDVNGYRATHVLAGVTWTISYEWLFYGSLLATAYFARKKIHLPFILTAMFVCLVGKVLFNISHLGFAFLFLCGMAVASLIHEGFGCGFSDRVASVLATSCLAFIFLTSSSGYSTSTGVVLALFFYLVCSGASLFGLLNTVPARRLGNISYSLYLMQGLALSLVFAIPFIREFAMLEPGRFWLAGVICAAVLVTASAITYITIERPAIALGKRLGRRQRRQQAESGPGTGTVTQAEQTPRSAEQQEGNRILNQRVVAEVD